MVYLLKMGGSFHGYVKLPEGNGYTIMVISYNIMVNS